MSKKSEKMSSGDVSPAKETETLVENGKNKDNIYCERCSSVILLQHKAEIVKKEVRKIIIKLSKCYQN